MPYTIITLSTATSSAPGASTAANLDWRNGSPTSVSVSAGATSSGAVVVQYTMDDLQLSSSPTWFGYSSIAVLGAGTTYNASNIGPTSPLFIQFTTPVAAVRINSSVLVTGPFTMRVIQGEGW